MKKIFALPIMAIGLLASQSWAEVCRSTGGGTFCQFDTGCYEMSSEYSGTSSCAAGSCTCTQVVANCIANGSVFSGVTGLNESNEYGKGVKCANNGGTWTNEGANPSRTALGCCQWDTETSCYTIWSGTDSDGKDGADKVTDCNGGANVFWTGQCLTSGNGCPSGTPAYNGKNPTDGFCCWEGNEYNNYNGYCGPIGGQTTVAKCNTDGGSIVTSCGSCNTSGSGGINPITISGRSVGLTVIPSGNVLHIISEKTATVELFSIAGAKVFSGKVSAGNSSLSLGNQRQGVYYAVVKSGSQKQTVKVMLK